MQVYFSAKVLDAHSPAFIMCTDINKHAANVAQRVSQTNGQSLEIVVTDLVMGFGDQISNKVDLLIFNPPYVVTPSNEVGTKDLSAAWAGGVDGREVTNRLLPKISDILAEGGLFYLVAIKENKIEDIKQILNKQGLTMTVVLTRRSGPELLSTLRFEKIESRVADLPV
ncbi:N6AMT1 [Bugula neritina]|uniref:Methyltransferase HEMK2 n=1 Tax=Bugula neritina TaxID=10212 RepID=A0A7J7JSG8_BUGNE|nr:N6AMT1 [Bugula neritina]